MDKTCVNYGHLPMTQWRLQNLYDKVGPVARQLFRIC